MKNYYLNLRCYQFNTTFIKKTVITILILMCVFSTMKSVISATHDCEKKLDKIENMMAGQGLNNYRDKISHINKVINDDYHNDTKKVPACILKKLGDFYKAINNDKNAFEYYEKAFIQGRIAAEDLGKMYLDRKQYLEALNVCHEDREFFSPQTNKIHDSKDEIFSFYLKDIDKGIDFFEKLKEFYSTDKDIDDRISEYKKFKQIIPDIANVLNSIPDEISEQNYSESKLQITKAKKFLKELPTEITMYADLNRNFVEANQRITKYEKSRPNNKKICRNKINELKNMVDNKTKIVLSEITCSSSNAINIIDQSNKWMEKEQTSQFFPEQSDILSNLKSLQSPIKESDPLQDALNKRITFFCAKTKDIAINGYNEKDSTSFESALFIRQHYLDLFNNHCESDKEIEKAQYNYQRISSINKINTVENLKKQYELMKDSNYNDKIKNDHIHELSIIGYEKAYKEEDFCQKIMWARQTGKLIKNFSDEKDQLNVKLQKFEKAIEPTKKQINNLFTNREYILLAKYINTYDCVKSFLENTDIVTFIKKIKIESTTFEQIKEEINNSKFIKNYFHDSDNIAAHWIYANLKESTGDNRLAVKYYFLADYYLYLLEQEERKKLKENEKQAENNYPCLQIPFIVLNFFTNIFTREKKDVIPEKGLDKLIQQKLNLFVTDQQKIKKLYKVNDFIEKLSVALEKMPLNKPSPPELISFDINTPPYKPEKKEIVDDDKKYLNYYLSRFLIEKAFKMHQESNEPLKKLYEALKQIDSAGEARKFECQELFNTFYKPKLTKEKLKFYGYAFWRMSEKKYAKALFDQNFYEFLKSIKGDNLFKKFFCDVLFETCLLIKDKKEIKKILSCNIDDPQNCKECSTPCKSIDRKTRKKIETLALTLIDLSERINHNSDEENENQIKTKLFINIDMNQDALYSNIGIKIELEKILKSSHTKEGVKSLINSYINSAHWRDKP